MEEEEWAHIVPGFTFARTRGHLLSLSLTRFRLCFFTRSFLSMATSHSQQGDYLFL